MKATVSNQSVQLTWNHVSNMSYQIIQYASPNNITTILNNPTESSYTITPLTNGITYNFGIAMYASGKAGPVVNISATPITGPTINTPAISLVNGTLSIPIDYGGLSEATIFFTAYKGELRDSIENGTTFTDLSLEHPTTPIEQVITGSPVTFSVNSTFISRGVTRTIIRNYFVIIVSNSISSTSTIWTNLDLTRLS